MAVNEEHEEDLQDLLEGLLEDDLPSDEHQRLCTLLEQSDEALTTYVDYLHLHASLKWDLAEKADVDSTEKPVWLAGDVARAVNELNSICESSGLSTGGDAYVTAGASRTGRAVWRRETAFVAAALVLVVGSVAGYVWQSAIRNNSQSVPIVSHSVRDHLDRSPPIAVLSNVSDIIWDESMSHSPDQTLQAGVLKISAGVAQLDFLSGATVVIEGPAELELVSDMRCNLRHGKLRAQVPPPAHGFTVGTDDFDVVDLGTEFAIRVSETELPEVHVIDGEVELRANINADSSPPLGSTGAVKKLLKRLRKGNGVRIGPTGELLPISMDAESFVGSERLAERLSTASKQRVAEWLNYSDRWSKDPDVVAYYIFERRNERTRALKNLGPNRPARLDAAVIGCEWTQGRWPDKGALAFTRSTDSVRFVSKDTFRSLSFAAWVRIDALKNRLNGIVLTEAFDDGEVHWQIANSGELELSVRYGDAGPTPDHDFRSPALLASDRFGQWVLLASVYDQDAGVVSHYIDGTRVSQEEMPVRQSVRFGDALIGNWDPAHKQAKSESRERSFNGRIDELLIIARPLTPDEISAIYKIGSPIGMTEK